MSQLRFDDRVVVVTGAGNGLGKEYALLFGSRGAKVVVNDLGGNFHGEGQSRAADLVVKEIQAAGGTAVADYNSVVDGDKIIDTALQHFGRVDVLINNAGILRDKSFPRISNQDWDLIHDVHLKGSFMTTRAAFPQFKKQGYGRVIMTSSNSGVYGNFGQANYSAAKLGLVGLANTIAIEGAKYNIHCNVIVPTAASRMTENILPEIFFQELKPKLIAPVVCYLCHESCEDNGSIIESAAGWATKLHIVRGAGQLLRTSIGDGVTPENVRDRWAQVTDMSQATRCNTIQEASAGLMTVLEKLQTPGEVKSTEIPPEEFKYNFRDVILYNLGVGASVVDPSDQRFLYENDADFSPLPTFFIQPGIIFAMTTSLTSSALPNGFDLSQVLHGEQYLELLDDMGTNGTLSTKGVVVDVMDKKSGALVVTECNSYDPSGKQVIRNQSATFIVGAGNFGGKSKPSPDVIPTQPAPDRKPDFTVEVKTDVNQAAVYRLSGDYNPLHIDPNFSSMAGYKVPILHGLCTLGVSVKAVIKAYANNDASLFKAVKTRFSKPVIPGQTLRVSMWKNNRRIHFKTTVVETGNDVLTGAYVDLKNTVSANPTSAVTLKSDAVFEGIRDRVADNPDKAKQVNGVFLYKITLNGKVTKEWTLDCKKGVVYDGPVKEGKADTTLTVADEDMVDIALGKVNPQTAFMKGKLKVTGNIMLTQKLVPLLKTEAKL